MKHILRIWFALALLFTVPCMASASDEPAAPVSALFYPNEIHLTAEENLTPENIPGKGAGLRIVLPSGAERNTFSVTVNGAPANSFYWLAPQPEILPLLGREKTVPPEISEEQAELNALSTAILSIQAKIDEKNASIKAREVRISLWEELDSSDEKFTTDDILKLDTALAERLESLYAVESKEKRELQDLQEELHAAQRALSVYEASQVRHVAVIPFSGKSGEPVFVRYSYIMPGSSRTSYRLTAYPARDALVIEQDVTLIQNTGKAWENVDIYISTTRRDTSIRPIPLEPWHIFLTDKSAAPSPAYATRAKAPMEQIANLDVALVQEEAKSSPAQEEKGTFRLWNLGKRNVTNGVGETLPLSKDEYKASYYYTLQPSMNPKGFLTASLSLDKALELPQGTASLFVDDVAVGNQTMSINGTKATIFFGTDPQVTAIMRDQQRTSGEKGIISKEQSVLWHWEIIVRNARGRPVDVRVQDPLPEGQDAAVKLVVTSTPKAEKTFTAMQLGLTKIYQWAFTLQPNETKTIEHKVEITAPTDKILNSGRRN